MAHSSKDNLGEGAAFVAKGAEACNWLNKRQLFIQKGNDDLVREALEHKKTNGATANKSKEQPDRQTAKVIPFKRKRRIEMKSMISDAKIKKDLLEARLAVAKVNEQLQSTIKLLKTKNAMRTFERLEEKIIAIDPRQIAGTDLEAGNDIKI